MKLPGKAKMQPLGEGCHTWQGYVLDPQGDHRQAGGRLQRSADTRTGLQSCMQPACRLTTCTYTQGGRQLPKHGSTAKGAREREQCKAGQRWLAVEFGCQGVKDKCKRFVLARHSLQACGQLVSQGTNTHLFERAAADKQPYPAHTAYSRDAPPVPAWQHRTVTGTKQPTSAGASLGRQDSGALKWGACVAPAAAAAPGSRG